MSIQAESIPLAAKSHSSSNVVLLLVFVTLPLCICIVLILTSNDQKHANLCAFLTLAWTISISVSWLFTVVRSFKGELASDAIVQHKPRLIEIPYGQIGAVRTNNARKQHDILVSQAEGTNYILIPAKASKASGKLMKVIVNSMPPAESTELPRLLREYYDEQVGVFGPDKVTVFLPCTSEMPRPSQLRLKLLIFHMIWAGLLFMLSLALDTAGMGLLFLFVFLISLIVFFIRINSNPFPIPPAWGEKAGIVICPLGLALVQGKMKGEMEWDDLQKVVYPTKNFLGNKTKSTIRLRFHGADVNIQNIYHLPTQIIHEKISQYWKPDEEEE